MNEWMNEWMNEREWVNELWMNERGWMNKQTNERTWMSENERTNEERTIIEERRSESASEYVKCERASELLWVSERKYTCGGWNEWNMKLMKYV